MNNGIKKPESSKIPKYIDTRVDDVYPVRKSGERCRVLYGKAKVGKVSVRIYLSLDI